MDMLQHLAELNRLHRLKASYFRLYDTQDWENWLALFTKDATLTADYEVSFPGTDVPRLILSSRDAIRDYMLQHGPGRRTVHHGHTPEIDIESETNAKGIWAMEDIVEYPDRRMHGHGHYHETYRKVDGEWRFATIHLTRLRLVNTIIAAPTAAELTL